MGEVVFATTGKKDYRNLDAQIRARIDEKLELLKADPMSPQHSKPLVGSEARRTARIGDWRIIFEVADDLVRIVRIRHRREVYSNL